MFLWSRGIVRSPRSKKKRIFRYLSSRGSYCRTLPERKKFVMFLTNDRVWIKKQLKLLKMKESTFECDFRNQRFEKMKKDGKLVTFLCYFPTGASFGVLSITLNYIQWLDFSCSILLSVDVVLFYNYFLGPFCLRVVVSVRIPSMAQINLLENYLH